MRIIIEFIVGSLLGLIIFRILVRKPEHFWEVLIGAAIITGGLIQGPGYALLDEFLMLFIIAAMGVAAFQKRIQWDFTSSRSPINVITLIFFGYLLLHSVYSVIIFSDVRLLRWTLLYLLLFLLFIIAQSSTFSKPDLLFTSRIICISGSIYLGLYGLHWLVIEKVLHLKWEDLQAISWSGSSYASFVFVAIIPAAIILIKYHPGLIRYLGFLAFFGVCLNANLYNSRIAVITLFLACILALFYLKTRHAAVLLAMFLMISIGSKYIIPTMKMIAESIMMPSSPRHSDRDRYDHLHAALTVLQSGSLSQAVFGYGEDQHKKQLNTIAEVTKYNKEKMRAEGIVRSSAFTAYVINQGIMGIALICVVLIINMWYLIGDQNYFIVPFYLISLVWSMITDYRDMIFVYLMVFSGIFLLKRHLAVSIEKRIEIE